MNEKVELFVRQRAQQLELPRGWLQLYIQMCEDIIPVLERKGLFNDFWFMLVEQKFGELACYPNISDEEIKEIVYKYEYISNFVCEECGALATQKSYSGYIFSACNEHSSERYIMHPISFSPIYTYSSWDENGEEILHELDCSDEWSRYCVRIASLSGENN